MRRDLHKAYCGFAFDAPQTGVATGNWGCGVFGGNLELKSVIQLMACSVAGRDCTYFTFGDQAYSESLAAFHRKLASLNVTVGELYRYLGLGLRLAECTGDVFAAIEEMIARELAPSSEGSETSSNGGGSSSNGGSRGGSPVHDGAADGAQRGSSGIGGAAGGGAAAGSHKPALQGDADMIAAAKERAKRLAAVAAARLPPPHDAAAAGSAALSASTEGERLEWSET